MSLLDKLFKPREVKAAEQITAYFKTLSAYTPVFRSRQGGIYEMELTRAAIHAFATHCSKLEPEVVGSARPNLKATLKTAPNPFMNTAQFLYRLATIVEVDTTAFIIPLTDQMGVHVTGFWPLQASVCELVEFQGEPWLRYQFSNGQKAAIEFSRVGVVTKYQYADDFFGGGNTPLAPTLDVLDMQRQAMEDAILQSANIRFLARLGQVLRPEDITAERNKFSTDNLSADNKSGVIMVDSKYADIKEIESKPWVIDAAQMALINGNVYSYLGTNEKILRNEFDEVVWDAYYEGKVEPLGLQIGLELTRMTYTARELAAGNCIMLSSNRLQYASNKTKIAVVTQLVDRGGMSNYQMARVFNLPQPPGPERWVIRGEYIDIDNLPTHTVDNAKSYLKPATQPAAAEGGDDDNQD